MIRSLTQKEWDLLHKLTQSNVWFRLEGKELQLAQQLSFEELTEKCSSNSQAFAFTWQGQKSVNLPIKEDKE